LQHQTATKWLWKGLRNETNFWADNLNLTREEIINPSSDCDNITYELMMQDTTTAGSRNPVAPAITTGFNYLNQSQIYVNTNESTRYSFVLKASSPSAEDDVRVFINIEVKATSLCKIYLKPKSPKIPIRLMFMI
jgi:hypothetical protein